MSCSLLVCAAAILLLFRPLEGASRYAGDFLALGAGARALGLGSAYVAVADDATAGYWNPAGLSTLESRQAHLMHAERFAGLVNHDYLALAWPGRLFRGTALSLMRIGVDDIPFTRLQDPGRPLGPDNRPVVVSLATSADYVLYLSAGHCLGQQFAAGASLKAIYRTVGSFRAYGFGLDLGLRYYPIPGFCLAAVLRDAVTTPIRWDTQTTDQIYPSLLLGLAYALPLGSGRVAALLATRTGGDAADAADRLPLNAGLEYQYRFLAVRLGLDEQQPAFGLGVRPHPRLELDLAYLQHDELEGTYYLSAAFHF